MPDYQPIENYRSEDDEARELEDLRWRPNMFLDNDLLMYITAARSIAAFQGMCEEDGCIAASRDDTTITAFDVLHDSSYDPGKALEALLKCPVAKGIEKKWTEEETKRFIKGLRQFGKNFFRIHKDLLPHKPTPELVEFYYLWKKTPGANNNRPHRRRRQGSLRRNRNTRTNSTASNTSNKKEQTPEPQIPSSDPTVGGAGTIGNNTQQTRQQTPIQKAEEQSSVTEDEASECDSDSSNTNKGSTLGEDSPSRMRTRNKQTAKEQNANKRPKRGTETPETAVTTEGPRTPNRNNASGDGKKKSTNNNKETPSKGKKRTNDVDNDGDDKDGMKRKRADVSSHHGFQQSSDVNNFPSSHFLYFQSPAESLTTDSRPGSVMDEGESNSEPPESMILLSKEAEEKDPLSIALPETPSSDTQQTKEDHVDNDQRSPSDVATPEDEADIPAQSSKTNADDDAKDKKLLLGENKNGDKEPLIPKQDVKEQEMLSKLANMKQEVNSSMIPTSADVDFQQKDPMFIKKEPNEDSSQDPTQAPTDLKVKLEVKSELNKSGSSLMGPQNNNAPSDINQMPNDQDNNNNAENLVCKPLEKLAAAGAVASNDGLRDAPKTPDNRQEGADYTMKTFMEQQQQQRDGVKLEQSKRDGTSPDGPKPFQNNEREMNEGKYAPPEHAPPGMMRNPFDQMMKFDPNMMKYELPHPGMDLKYLPPDHPARAYAEGALKSQFSADNLIKSSSHYPPDMKYPLPPSSSSANEGPIDASRITPNQDSQGSNSNSQPPTLPSPSIQSPLTSQASLIPPGGAAPSGMFVGHPGLNLSGHLPANHPSLMGSSGPIGPQSLPPTSGSSPFLPIQPGSLHRPDAISSTGSRTFPTSTSTNSISSLSSVGSAFGPNPLYATSRLSDNPRDGLNRTSPLGPLLHGSPHPLLSHPLPLHLGHPGMGLPPHHPAAHLPPHLHNHLMQPLGGPNTPLPLIGGPQPSTNPLNSLIEAAGRRTPTSISTSSINHMTQSSQHNSVIQSPSAPTSLGSSLSRASPLVHPSSGGAFSHRPQSPSSNHPANLSRNSPLHLGGQPVGPSPAAISAERERQLMRQQSPHMTPPPTSSASSLGASPLSKMYGSRNNMDSGPRPSNSPPPHGFRPGASPPVVRHPQMPLALPIMGPSSALQSPVMHPQSPYPHHLLHPSMFYAAHNPFNSPYPYSPYGPPPGAFSYIKGGPLDGPLLQHHPTSIPPPRSDEPPSPHANGPKSITSMHDKIKSPAPSKSQQNSNHSGSNQPTQGGPHGPYSSPYPSSHPFMENTLPPGKTSHIEALRAHAASAAGGSSHHPTEPVHIDAVDIEPDPEPPSPVHPIDRGPSPEAKPDDTECHRSQSAM